MKTAKRSAASKPRSRWATAKGVDAGENVQVPLGVDMSGASLPKAGAYELHVYVDTAHQRTVQFWAEETR